MPEQRGKWGAGQVSLCEDADAADHGIQSVHIVIVCNCGAAFMSTDGSIALTMADRHAGALSRPSLPSDDGTPASTDVGPDCG